MMARNPEPLEFRFADEEDAEDIADLVNEVGLRASPLLV